MHKRQGLKSSRLFAHKQTNTPSNFVLCSLCEEKFTPKLTPNGCLGDQERSIKEYNNALDYINSCHSIINHMMTQNKELKELFVGMPNVPNFLDLFSVLLTHGLEAKKKQKLNCEPHMIRSGNLRKTKSTEEDHQRPTSDSETSDFELDAIQNAPKFPMARFKSKLPKTGDTIYEEDIPENLSSQTKGPILKSNQKKSPPASPQRTKRYSDIVAAPVQDMNRKSKPRSYSANAPRSKVNVMEKKSGHDLSANYSDTLISNVGSKQADLTQQELDKYAKELLASGSGSPVHTPRSSSPDNRTCPTTDKSPTRSTRKSPKPSTPPNQGNRRYSEILKKGYSSNQGQGISATDTCVAKQTSLQKVTHTVEQSPSSMIHNSGQQTPQLQMKRQKVLSQTSMMDPPQGNRPPTPTVKVGSQGGSNYSVFASLQQGVKEKGGNYDDNPYAMQEYMQIQMKKHEGSRSKINEAINGPPYEKQEVYEQRKPNLRATPSKCNQYNNPSSGNKAKQKECFHSTRKLSPADMKIIESQVQLFVEQHIESDEMKTDSDIEEDHSVKKPIAEERPVRNGDDRQKNFRRKHLESEDEDQVGKFTEEHAYSTTTDGYQRIHQVGSSSPKRSHMSDESSDIKSDEDAYDHRQRPVHVHRRGASYTFNHSGARH